MKQRGLYLSHEFLLDIYDVTEVISTLAVQLHHPSHRHSTSLSQQPAFPNLLGPKISAHIPSRKSRDLKQKVLKGW